MEKKQGFFSALREEVARGLTPARARGRSRSRSESPRRGPSPVMELLLLPRRRWRRRGMASGPAVPRSGSLAPLMEGPDSGEGDGDEARKERGWGQWVKGQLSWAPSVSTSAAASCRPSDLRLLLGVMAAPLAPIHVCSTDPLPHLSIKDTPIVSAPILSFLHYHILPSFMVVLNIELYGVAKIPALSSRLDLVHGGIRRSEVAELRQECLRDGEESGGFVLWQMAPDMWYVELAAGGGKIRAGCNGKLVWRHTPWLGAHAAKGPVRPLRRALQV
ncbi:hypothetical protein GW17_00039415 [Ensete ventricosum]|nr:hypothetical protein GW17_00039415 [Ensete ventricosum]